MQTEDLIVRWDGPAKLNIKVKSDWLLNCFTFVMKSPGCDNICLLFKSDTRYVFTADCHIASLIHSTPVIINAINDGLLRLVCTV